VTESAEGMVDKAAIVVLVNLAMILVWRQVIGDECRILGIVEVVEAGWLRGKKNAACTSSLTVAWRVRVA
jgi:hypothetical protein